jgi:hypothetical protein
MIMAVAFQTACILPPSLEIGDFDAGPSSPPVITDSVSPEEFRFPGPITLERSDPRFFSLTLADNDIDDTLFVRMYVDYAFDAPTNFASDCTAVPTGSIQRQASCPAARLCDNVPATDDAFHALEVMVSDREFLPAGDPQALGQPAFRAVAKGANPTIRAWLLACKEAL